MSSPTPDGQSAAIDIQIEPRIPAPILERVAPEDGIFTGGKIAQLLGENFQEAASVTVGGNEILDVDYVSPTVLAFTVPEGAAGLVEIVLTNPDGQSATIEFTYVEFLPEDINRDGDIDIFDLVQVGSGFGDTGEGLAADIDRNGVVDIFDLVRVARQFGKSIKVSAAPSIHAASRRFDFSSARQGFKQVDAHGRTISMDSDISRRLQMALTELERISNVMPEVRFGADLLRRWMIANAGIPTKTQLLPNYPNPFNPETWIAYHLARDADVTLSIYDTRGAMVRQFDLGHQSCRVLYRSGSCNILGWLQQTRRIGRKRRLFLSTQGGGLYIVAADGDCEIVSSDQMRAARRSYPSRNPYR